jgi:hypothetical protein
MLLGNHQATQWLMSRRRKRRFGSKDKKTLHVVRFFLPVVFTGQFGELKNPRSKLCCLKRLRSAALGREVIVFPRTEL